VFWYRIKFQAPAGGGKLALVALEIDGAAQVYVNGTACGDVQKPRKPFEVDISRAVKPGENAIAIRVDHSRLTELMLGGIVRPVLVVEK
jgi:beta-galactosidase/beta-glucuronidase